MGEVLVVDTIVSPVPVIDVAGDITCNEIEVELSAQFSILNNPVTYRWIDPNGDLISTSEIAMAQYPGAYILELTDVVTGCLFSTEDYVYDNTMVPIVDLPFNNYELNCANNFTVELEPIVSWGWNITYTWLFENNFVSSNIDIIVTESGTYELIVTDYNNGCTSQIFVEVTDNGFDVNLDINTATCDLQDGSATVSSSLINPIYEWNTGDQGSTVSGLGHGWYSVTITDADNNCSRHQNFYVDEDISCKVLISGYVVNDSNNTCMYDPIMEGMEQVMIKLFPVGYF